MTALVIIIFNFGGFFEYGGDGGMVYIDGVGYEGAGITSKAFAKYIPFSNVFLTIAVVLFAVSTMISWSYYGLKAWTFLFGKTKLSEYSYKLLFLLFIIVGSSVKLGAVLDFSDMMILAMAFPNIIGLLILSKEVRVDLDDYYSRLKSGVIKRFK